MRRSIAVAGVTLLVGLVGCGGNDSNNNKATGTTGNGGNATETINVSETDFKLAPSSPRVTKPGLVEIKATNDGKTTHSLEVEGPGGEKKLASNLEPGDSGTLEVNLNKPGRYEWYCPIDDHKGLGMKGEIVVGSGGSSGSQSKSSSSGGSSGGGSGGGSGGY
jgi:plastocyanin